MRCRSASGAACVASLYEAAFAVVIAWFTPQQRATALLALTVVAGFSSTVFLPLTGWLVATHGWRTTLLVLAAVQAATLTTWKILTKLRCCPRHATPIVQAILVLHAVENDHYPG